ncbi:protein-L-isoaspartate(D-aspartate) O-methyltransferase [Variovorax dokdonensis]|uniref:Protein-L-isoaspartate O-methyltransferase n=2 Tax=Variovorax dokdonensis TaxID=344883 RepID=A0ABT7NEJ3_9BURK|nr:protein-L-isoaspartate(D-aspartate) O-methyltransferase [Variovorax dokdonensis]MDM0046342.1 protein-L-isoaspartate(D-aspartate) O-methyltransferase [Variovorax dokdonensis]
MPARPAPALEPSVRPASQQSVATRPNPTSPTAPSTAYEAVRARMVQKLAGQGITDARVLSAMGTVERHRFVDSALMNQAYEDTSLPIGLGQTISKPSVVARMIELLLAAPAMAGRSGARLGRVLEVGTGCGYQAAVLGRVADEVYSIERLRGLNERARANLRHFRLANVHLLLGDGMQGYAKGAPYAGIIAAAGGDVLPQTWIDQLAVGGRIVAPIRSAQGGQALVVIDRSNAGVQRSVLEAVNFVPLKSGIA